MDTINILSIHTAYTTRNFIFHDKLFFFFTLDLFSQENRHDSAATFWKIIKVFCRITLFYVPISSSILAPTSFFFFTTPFSSPFTRYHLSALFPKRSSRRCQQHHNDNISSPSLFPTSSNALFFSCTDERLNFSASETNSTTESATQIKLWDYCRLMGKAKCSRPPTVAAHLRPPPLSHTRGRCCSGRVAFWEGRCGERESRSEEPARIRGRGHQSLYFWGVPTGGEHFPNQHTHLIALLFGLECLT